VLEGLARVEKRTRATGALEGSTALSGRPRHLAVSANGAEIYVANFISPPVPGEDTQIPDVSGGAGQLFVIAADAMSLSATIPFGHSNRAPSELSGPGIANYLSAPVIAGSKAYVPSKQDNITAGAHRGYPMTFDQTVRAVTSVVDLVTRTEQTGLRIDHDNASVATGAAFSGEGRYLFVGLETSREIAVYDTQLGFQLRRLAVGRAPQGIALSSDGRTVYAHNFMDRTISRWDVTRLVALHVPDATDLGARPDGDERSARTRRAARQAALLRRAGRPARARQLHELRVMPQRRRRRRPRLGLHGLRRGPAQHDRPARTRSHGPCALDRNFDEIQDFEGQIRLMAAGAGLMTNAQFTQARARCRSAIRRRA
jgi:hypothetical protein